MLFDAIFIIFYVLLYNLYLCLNIFLLLQKQLGFYFCFEYSISRLSPVFSICVIFVWSFFLSHIHKYQSTQSSVATRRNYKIFFLDAEISKPTTTRHLGRTLRECPKNVKLFGKFPLCIFLMWIKIGNEHLFRLHKEKRDSSQKRV